MKRWLGNAEEGTNCGPSPKWREKVRVAHRIFEKTQRQLARRDQQAGLIKALFMSLSFVLIAAIEIVAIMLQLNLAKVGCKYVLDLHDYLGMQQWSPTLIAARKACIACDSFAVSSMS